MKRLPIFYKKQVIGYLKIDAEDYHIIKNKSIFAVKGYPCIKIKIGNVHKTKYIHRLVMNEPTNSQIDHINHDILDARKANLRIVNHKQNHENLKLCKRNTSGYRGVSKTKNGRWYACVMNNYKSISCGEFDTPEEANIAVINKRKELGFISNDHTH